jgi:GNAT superfamily N-acetyltransferase
MRTKMSLKNLKGVHQNLIKIVELTRDTANYLTKDIYFAGSDILDNGLIFNLLQSVGFQPRSTRLVAYHRKDKIAIGFLCLKENTNTFYSIEKVFVHPNYRNLGIATRLLNFAVHIAKKKGARKISLIVYPSRTTAINLYKKLGFEEIGSCILGQGYIKGASISRVIKRISNGQGLLVRQSLGKESRLNVVKINNEINRKTLFTIFKSCTDRKIVNFFEITSENLAKDYKLLWKPRFFRDLLINYELDSYAAIFTIPLSSKSKVELYSSSENTISSVLDSLLRVLTNRGIGCLQIMLFNSSNEARRWFNNKNMEVYDFVVMGKNLEN